MTKDRGRTPPSSEDLVVSFMMLSVPPDDSLILYERGPASTIDFRVGLDAQLCSVLSFDV
jgi:hypothetical protein